MLFKKIIGYHLIPICISMLVGFMFIRNYKKTTKQTDILGHFSSQVIKSTTHIDFFNQDDLNINNQVAFSIALKQKVPVLLGSSELTSHHLTGIASRFFNQDPKKDRFLSVGHAGFQSFALLCVLAANKQLLQGSKLTIILSPGWFEKQYASGTSLKSFLEFCPPNYLYQIKQDTTIDAGTKNYIKQYLYGHYDNITRPDATIRSLSKKDDFIADKIFNYPFVLFNENEIALQEQTDSYLISQKVISDVLSKANPKPYLFLNQKINWDSLETTSNKEFKAISNNNDIGVENSYFDSWLKNKPKKKLTAVTEENNNEYKDLMALIRFLKLAKCEPLFVIMPLNTKAHQNLEVLQPIITSINNELQKNSFKVLDMFTPNLKNYEVGILEDIMHPYNTGWYQIDKFILENYHD